MYLCQADCAHDGVLPGHGNVLHDLKLVYAAQYLHGGTTAGVQADIPALHRQARPVVDALLAQFAATLGRPLLRLWVPQDDGNVTDVSL